MNVIRFIQRWWWARKRAIDLKLLWPECKRQARNLEDARYAFAIHAINDPAWVREYEDRLHEEIAKLT